MPVHARPHCYREQSARCRYGGISCLQQGATGMWRCRGGRTAGGAWRCGSPHPLPGPCRLPPRMPWCDHAFGGRLAQSAPCQSHLAPGVGIPWDSHRPSSFNALSLASMAATFPCQTLSVGAAPAGAQELTPSADPELEYDREVYPIGISLAEVAIVGRLPASSSSCHHPMLRVMFAHCRLP